MRGLSSSVSIRSVTEYWVVGGCPMSYVVRDDFGADKVVGPTRRRCFDLAALSIEISLKNLHRCLLL
jgi:hypothetical protein